MPASEPTPAPERLHWWDRWNRALFPWLGPPPLGPYGEPELPSIGPKPCPLCGQAMELHIIQRTADDHTPTRLHCPTTPAAATGTAAA